MTSEAKKPAGLIGPAQWEKMRHFVGLQPADCCSYSVCREDHRPKHTLTSGMCLWMDAQGVYCVNWLRNRRRFSLASAPTAVWQDANLFSTTFFWQWSFWLISSVMQWYTVLGAIWTDVVSDNGQRGSKWKFEDFIIVGWSGDDLETVIRYRLSNMTTLEEKIEWKH